MRIFYLLLFCLFGNMLAAQEGIEFRKLSFDEALAQAKKENKLVFMDCYTVWCGPCRQMAEQVFPQKAAGDFFNPRFVSLKCDMEYGEGVELAKRFNVLAYPTLLIITPDGRMQHKFASAIGVEELIREMEKGLDEKRCLATLGREYTEGRLDNRRLLEYCDALAGAAESEKAAEICSELWGKLSETEKMQKEFFPLYTDASCTVTSPMFGFLLSHIADIRRNVGKEEVDRLLVSRYAKILHNMIMGYEVKEGVAIGTLQQQIPPLRIPVLDSNLELAELVANRKVKELSEYIAKRMPESDAATIVYQANGFRGIIWAGQGEIPAGMDKQGARLAKLLVDKMEKEADTMTGENFSTYFGALACFQENLSPELEKRLVALGDKVFRRVPDNGQFTVLKQDLERMRERN